MDSPPTYLRLVHSRWKATFFFLVICVVSALPAHAQTSSASPAQQLFDLLNQEREKAGLRKYSWDDHLSQAALTHSKLLAEHRELSHQFPEEADVPERLRNSGSRFTASAENVATASTIEEAHQALMASPGHRANILSTKYNAAGIAIVESKGNLYVTQDFAWVAPTYTEEQFRNAFAAAFNRARKENNLAAVEVNADARLHSSACSTNGTAPIVTGQANETAAVVFTSSDPEKLPPQLTRYVHSEGFRRMNIGVCFRPDARYGYANFWVALAFAE